MAILTFFAAVAIAAPRDAYARLADDYRRLRVEVDAQMAEGTAGPINELVSELKERLDSGEYAQVAEAATTLEILTSILVLSNSDNASTLANLYPVSSVQLLGDVSRYDLDRYMTLSGSGLSDPIRSVYVESGRAVAAVLDYAASRPLNAHSARASGLLHANQAILATDRLLLEANARDPRLANAARMVRAGADALTALRIGAAEATLDRVRMDDLRFPIERALFETEGWGGLRGRDAAELAHRGAVLRWLVELPSAPPRWRGVGALRGDEVVALAWARGSAGTAVAEIASERAWFLAGIVGMPDLCAPPNAWSSLPDFGADFSALDVASNRLFHWLPETDEHGLHRLGGLVANLPAEEQDAVLCALSLRPDHGVSVPAALARAERAFILEDRKDLAYQFALISIANAQELLDRGHPFPDEAWWVPGYGQLLAPLLNVGYQADYPNLSAFLQRWAYRGASAWIAGLGDAPELRAAATSTSTPKSGGTEDAQQEISEDAETPRRRWRQRRERREG